MRVDLRPQQTEFRLSRGGFHMREPKFFFARVDRLAKAEIQGAPGEIKQTTQQERSGPIAIRRRENVRHRKRIEQGNGDGVIEDGRNDRETSGAPGERWDRMRADLPRSINAPEHQRQDKSDRFAYRQDFQRKNRVMRNDEE